MRPYHLLFDKVLSRSDPEQAHERATKAIRVGRPVARLLPRHGESVQALGLTFPGPLGLAAGFDKNAESIDALAALGFSFVEIGTVTGEPQPGNPKPRLFRLVEDRAVVNRMGFNNDGAEVVARRLAERRRTGVIVGVNIGKTKLVPEDEAIADYEKSTRLLAPYADYLVVNVSSPNTPGLRDLQAVDKLKPLLAAVRAQADETVPSRHVPLLVKIAPDLSDEDVLAVSDLAVELGLDGIVATNTTIGRAGLTTAARTVEDVGAGGLSGEPLMARALEVTRMVRDRVGPDLVVIGVGGITTAEDARDRLAAGATLVQAYTAFIYEGPLWPRRLQRQLAGLGEATRVNQVGPVQVTGEVLSTKKVGAFHHLTLVAPGIAERFRPGNLVSVVVGGPLSERLARRTFAIQKTRLTAYGGTVEVVFEPTEPGEEWLVSAPAGTKVDLVGPLGRPFALPKTPVPCVLVGQDAAAAPLQALAERLRERSCDVHMLLGAATEPRLFGALDARRVAKSVTVVTGDGSLGIKGDLLSQLPALVERVKADVVYAAGPLELLHGVAAVAEQHGAWSQTAVMTAMPCGTGLCGACSLPVVGADGVVRQARVCTEGPVFRGDRVCWGPVEELAQERTA